MRRVWSAAAALGSKSTTAANHRSGRLPGGVLIRGTRMRRVPQFRISDAARLLGVSDDTVRRWVDAGALPVQPDPSNRKVIDGAALAEFAREHATPRPTRPTCSAPRATAWSGS